MAKAGTICRAAQISGKQFAPGNAISEFRVQRIAASLWRLDRHDRAEAAMLERARLRAAQDDLFGGLRLPTTSNEDIPGTTTAREPWSKRTSFLIDRLRDAEQELQQHGGLSEQSMRDIVKLFGTSDSFAFSCRQTGAHCVGWRRSLLGRRTFGRRVVRS
jgi:hypothetical protein